MSTVLFEEKKTANGQVIGVATLNVEQTLNSLSLEMVDLLLKKMNQWKVDSQVACVVLQAAGEKAFCAGGDIVMLYESMCEFGDSKRNLYSEQFFGREYALDFLIHTFPKAVIVWGHGIVMGGGVGLMSGASHRVVTEKSRIAMPEISIGLFPDVGSTWFLNRAPGKTGLFLGLTGANFNAKDALYIGFADSFASSDKKDSFLNALQEADFLDSDSHSLSHNKQLVSDILAGIMQESQDLLDQLDANVEVNREFIDECCDVDSLDQLVNKLDGASIESKWLSKAVATLEKGCPVTAHIVWQQLQRGQDMALEDVFAMEFCVAMQCCMQGDFQEGVRALLIEKDGNPTWQYGSISAVPDDVVDSHFEYKYLSDFSLNPEIR